MVLARAGCLASATTRRSAPESGVRPGQPGSQIGATACVASPAGAQRFDACVMCPPVLASPAMSALEAVPVHAGTSACSKKLMACPGRELHGLPAGAQSIRARRAHSRRSEMRSDLPRPRSVDRHRFRAGDAAVQYPVPHCRLAVSHFESQVVVKRRVALRVHDPGGLQLVEGGQRRGFDTARAIRDSPSKSRLIATAASIIRRAASVRRASRSWLRL